MIVKLNNMKPWKSTFLEFKLSNILLFILISFNCIGQEWEIVYPVPNIGRQVVSTFDSCYLATGTNGWNDPGITIKISQEGEIVSVSPYGGYSIKQTYDSGYILAGSENLEDAFLKKFDKFGNPVWNKIYGGSDEDYFSAVIQSSDSCFVACGYSQSYSDSMIYIVKTDKLGNLLWRRNFRCFIYGLADDLIEIGSNYYISGHTQDSSYNYNPFIIKLSDAGETIWRKDFQMGFTGLSIALTQDSSLITTGKNILSKFSLNGDSLWSRSFDPSFDILSVDTASEKGFILSGGIQILTPSGFQSLNTLVKTDSLGNIVWTKNYPTGYDDFTGSFTSVIETRDLGFVACGYSIYENSNIKMRVIKTDSVGSIVTNTDFQHKTESKQIFPNPTHGKVNINLVNITCFKVYNVSGSLVMSVDNNNEIDLSSLPNGIYLLKVFASETITIEKVIKQ